MLEIINATWLGFNEDNCSRIAAALAYYTAFSLAPVMILILGIGQLAFEPEDLRGRVRTQVEIVVGPAGADQIETMLDTNQKEKEQGIVATLIGAFVVLVGATGLFSQLQSAVNDVWAVKPDPDLSGIRHFLTKRVVSLGMLLTIAFLIMISITASSVIHSYNEIIDNWLPGQSASVLMTFVDYGLTLAVLTILFAAMFRYLPDAEVAWSHVWVGGLVTTVMFLVGKFAIALYVDRAGTASTYGAAGSLIVILMWVYYSALIFLFGAEFTQAWAKRTEGKIQPEEGAVKVVKRVEIVKS